MGYGRLIEDLQRAFGAGQQRGILEDEAIAAQLKGFERLAPMRQAQRAEEVEAEYGPEAAGQVRAGTFPGKVPYKAARTAELLEKEETGLADLARSMGFPMETITPGQIGAGPPAQADVLREPVVGPDVRTPLKRLPKAAIPLLSAAARARTKAPPSPSLERDIAEQTKHLPPDVAFQERQRLRAEGAGLRLQSTEDVGPTRKDRMSFMQQYHTDSRKFSVARDAYARAESVAKAGTPFGDMSLIFAYMKNLDPESTVLPSEYANAANAANIPDRIRNMYNRAIEGTMLQPNQRRDIHSQTKRLFSSKVESQVESEATYRQQAGALGIPETDVPDLLGRYRPRPGKKLWSSDTGDYEVRRKP